MLTSRVHTVDGTPTLLVDGRPITPMAYITYLPEHACYADFAEAGFRLFSFPLFFAKRPINLMTPDFEALAEGIFESTPPAFSLFDREMERLLSVCPDALVFPRVNANLSFAWERAHPEELCDGALSGETAACFSSDVWASEVEAQLTAFVRYVEASPYRDHVVGYQIAGGNTEEWFSLDGRGSVGPRTRERFVARYGVPPVEDDPTFVRFLSDVVAERLDRFAACVKRASEGRVVVGAFYGYSLAVATPYFCQHALGRVLASPSLDFLCSPVPYDFVRPLGFDHASAVPTGSLRLHGKLYFVENDTRTHLSGAPVDIPKFRDPVWYGPSREDTLCILKLHFARALVHGHALWWFDMWGGWYADDAYRALHRRMHEIGTRALSLPRGSTARLAVLIDEHSYAACHTPPPHAAIQLLHTLGICAVPYDAYLLSDLSAIRDRYDAFVLLAAAPTEETKAAEALLGARALSLRLGRDDGQTTEALRAWLCAQGLTPLSDRPAAVFLSHAFLFVHAHEDGPLSLRTDGFRTVDLFTGRRLTFPTHLRRGESLLFVREEYAPLFEA